MTILKKEIVKLNDTLKGVIKAMIKDTKRKSTIEKITKYIKWLKGEK